jgi:hypothetical protein
MHHHGGSNFGEIVMYGIAFAIGWYIGGLLISLASLVLWFLWTVSGAFPPVLRYATRGVLGLIVIAAALFVLVEVIS